MQQPPRFLPRLHKQRPAFDAKTSLVICPRTLFVPRREQFSENCENRGIDNDIQGQISKLIFVLNGAHWVYYPSIYFENWGKHLNIPQLFSRVTRLDQSRPSENI